MSGKLSFQLEVLGVEQVAKKLSDLDKIASNVGKKAISFSDFSNFSSSAKRLNPHIFDQDGKASGKSFGKAFLDGRQEAMQQLARRGSSQQMIEMAAAIAQSDYDRNNPKRSGGGGGGGRVGRLISFFGGDGQGPLSQIFGALGAFRIALWELQPIIRVVEFAFKQLAQAIEQGSKLYTDSAKLGTSTGRLAGTRNVAALLGISEGEADALLEQGQFGASRTRGNSTRSGTQRRGGVIDFEGSLLGGRSPAQLAKLQQLINMQKDLASAEQDTAAASFGQANSARALFEEMYNFKVLTNDLRAIFQDLAAILHPVIAGLTAIFDLFVKQKLETLNFILAVGQKLGIIPKDDSGSFGRTGIGSGRIPVSAWEKIGFMFGGGGNGLGNPQNQIANNTKAMVSILNSIAGGIKQIAGGGSGGGLQSSDDFRSSNPALFGGTTESFNAP